MKRIVVLASGYGSNLQVILDSCRDMLISGQVVAVFSNKHEATALNRARNFMIPTHVILESRYTNKDEFDHQLIHEINYYHPHLIVLAGYMRILSIEFIEYYSGQILNIHPSLLPRYPGLNTHQKVIRNRDYEHGASVHFVTKHLDQGPVVLQSKIPVFSGDTIDSLTVRVKDQEHVIYPQAINWFINDRLVMYNGRAWLDGKRLPKSGYPKIFL
ncbi:phosphoribosylglycinamide formyltransferase [Candidatus Erwinia haradaeae]|uniref:Phosphoribosylglycinamide formyltransferase n=1 Tax=Candidatus Erwinia haradaeae TaxID=1922217 RepID=A0A803FST8_9GAMM|nr:phosphoribosylglycinamide formyltransferase [Candidatus Erwinia haradaeae]VFP87103.1 Phosphoribosylglycinamide formyltransferase [Candidatus Erwinia haradaeae]